jgi:hypothetical protein
MTYLKEQSIGGPTATSGPKAPPEEPLYTRYCAAPRPLHPVGEPRLIHSLLVATWLGRLIDPLPGHGNGKRIRR